MPYKKRLPYKREEEKQEKSDEVLRLNEKELEEIRENARQKAREAKHNWKQRGPYIVCTSCDYEHGINIGTQKILTGLDKDGVPILKNRGE